MKQFFKGIGNFLIMLISFSWWSNIETKETPPTESIKPPAPIVKPLINSEYRIWSSPELFIALYAKMFDLAGLNLTPELIAASIGRTEGALIRKGYRSFKKAQTSDNSKDELIKSIVRFYELVETDFATETFYRTMYLATKGAQTGTHPYYLMMHDGMRSIRMMS